MALVILRSRNFFTYKRTRKDRWCVWLYVVSWSGPKCQHQISVPIQPWCMLYLGDCFSNPHRSMFVLIDRLFEMIFFIVSWAGDLSVLERLALSVCRQVPEAGGLPGQPAPRHVPLPGASRNSVCWGARHVCLYSRAHTHSLALMKLDRHYKKCPVVCICLFFFLFHPGYIFQSSHREATKTTKAKENLLKTAR